MKNISYHRHRFPQDIIKQAVWLYFRFTMSYRDVEELLAERGIDVSYETGPATDLFRSYNRIVAKNMQNQKPDAPHGPDTLTLFADYANKAA